MRARRGACASLLVLVAACAPAVPLPAPAAASSVDLSGEWISSSGVDPREPVVTITRPCGQTVTEWRFTDASPTLSAILIRGAPLTGEPHELPIAAWMSGSTDTVEFELRGGRTMATYHLRYDPRARRLRGTRDGDSVWFAPLQVLEPRHCRDGITVPAPFNLSGSWLAGQGAAEPAAASVTFQPDCRYNPAAWVVQQTKDSVEAWSFPESMNQGTRSLDTRVNVPSTGRVSGLDVTIQSATSRYQLRYDPESGHLRGTLNGAPFWAVRQVVERPGACPAVP